MSAPTLRRESIATRHARLFDREYGSSWYEGLGRVAMSVVIVGGILASLYLFAG